MGEFVKRLVPVKSVITDLIDMTDEEATANLPTLVKWAIKGDRRIGSWYPFVRRSTTATVSNCCIPIPCDAVYIAGIIFGNPGCDCNTLWNEWAVYTGIETDGFYQLTPEKTFFFEYHWSSANKLYRANFDWQIQGGDIVIQGANFEGQTVTLLYYGYPVDKEDLPMVWDSHLDPLSLWLKLFLAEKEQWKNFRRIKLNKGELLYISDLRTQYHKAVRNARVQDTELSPLKEDECTFLMNSPLTGKGNVYLHGSRRHGYYDSW